MECIVQYVSEVNVSVRDAPVTRWCRRSYRMIPGAFAKVLCTGERTNFHQY